jgi:hypothetical protein
MNNTTLACITPLLEVLRAYPELHEVRPTAFHLHDRDFIHFHDEPAGIFADVRLAKGRVRLPVSTHAEQSECLARIEHHLSSIAFHARNKRPRKRQRRTRDAFSGIAPRRGSEAPRNTEPCLSVVRQR